MSVSQLMNFFLLKSEGHWFVMISGEWKLINSLQHKFISIFRVFILTLAQTIDVTLVQGKYIFVMNHK